MLNQRQLFNVTKAKRQEYEKKFMDYPFDSITPCQ